MKATLAAVALTALCALHAPPVRADGMSFFRPEGEASVYRALAEEEQVALVACDGGRERLLVTIGVDLEGRSTAVWLLPVLGRPNEVKVALADSFLPVSGRSPSAIAFNSLADVCMTARATQIYPFIIEGMLMSALSGGGRGFAVGPEVDRWGLRAEAMSADSVDGLAGYLHERGVDVAAADLASFGSYLDGRHCIVVTRVDSWETVEAEFGRGVRGARGPYVRRPCLVVEFPADRPFYPMHATSGYGDLAVPVTLCVDGYWQVDADVPPGWGRTGHYVANGRSTTGPTEMRGAFVPGTWYTAVRARGPAGGYKDDLYFRPARPPLRTRYALATGAVFDHWYGVPAYFLFVGALSYLAGGLSGMLMFRRWRGFARLGLWNVLTLFALAYREERIGGEMGKMLAAGRGKGFWRVPWSIAFSLVFVALTILAQLLLSIPLGAD